jgi:hypothetical protein
VGTTGVRVTMRHSVNTPVSALSRAGATACQTVTTGAVTYRSKNGVARGRPVMYCRTYKRSFSLTYFTDASLECSRAAGPGVLLTAVRWIGLT